MQYRPTATEILDSLAELLDNVLLPALPDALQHRARVGANLTRIVRRELELGPATAAREHQLLAIRSAMRDEQELWRMLVEIVRGDLAIAKPGYDRWEGM
ncbi:DUF6285 domain-containing protein [Nocardia pseudobrasiliensis]|uniref:DUF6285 domain-containing protein n=1 Tax=Nocardia pseudobrasiliensis TaxID=45979 RepID=A0A370ICV7_9NOCA|nr:DUF6285 domain-containing protein [Nocardia pseudobrasiliensis]RDI67244.1 hypothetical protein DFR76_103315 [Nocardia pseudobrasiliensis]